MGHIDDTHKPKDDRQPHRHHEEDRAEAYASERCLGCKSEGLPGIDTINGFGCSVGNRLLLGISPVHLGKFR